MGKKFENILKESIEIFQLYGIKSISMEDLSKKLKISKKTLYQYIDNKADLVKKILRYRKTQNEITIKENLKTKGNAIDNLIKVSVMLKQKTHCFNANFLFDLNKYYSEIVDEHLANERKSFVEKISTNLNKGKAEELFRKELDTDLVARLYINNIEYLQKINFFNNEQYSHETVFSVLFENHIRAIATPKGVKYFEGKINELEITKEKNK
ncbi:MAG: TetR/AcrR family transcriptional regulator [Bacteroidota bacterium]|nr:TetR/AcrR family transcriptional regulator [Bacteroidota bacterium]